TGDACSGGVCVGSPRNCDDGNPCTADSCDPVTGNCTHASVPDGTSCSDGNACNGAETCQAGTCTSGTPVNCNDNNPCTTDSCFPGPGARSHGPVPDGTSCSDGLACNGAETCQNGTCTAGTPVNCNDGNPCTTDSCNNQTGACSHGNVADGTSCSDGNACNGA